MNNAKSISKANFGECLDIFFTVSSVDVVKFAMDFVLISTFLEMIIKDCYEKFKDFPLNEVQSLLFTYGAIMVVSYFTARKYFSQKSDNFLFLFGFCIASILFAVGYTLLNGLYWILLIPFLLLALPNLINKNDEDGNNNNKTTNKSNLFILKSLV